MTKQIANLNKAKLNAYQLLDDFGYLENLVLLPVEPLKIARTLGIKVYCANFSPTYKNISGFFDAEENAIYVNQDEYPIRQIFTIAHELGHKILHEEWLKSSDYKVLMRDQLAAPKDDPIEQEADTFAAYLLVPKMLLDRYKKMATISQLATMFAVSEPIIKNRIRNGD